MKKTVHELAKIDQSKIEKLKDSLQAKIKNSSVLKDMIDFINVSILDPYMTYDSLLNQLKLHFRSVQMETSTTGGVPGYATPKAFSKSGQTSNAGIETAKSQGYMKAPKTHKWFKELYEVSRLDEVSYNEYKKYPGMSSKQKLNMAIKECNRALWEVERYLKQNKKLKEEEQLGLDEYWKSTGRNLVKMHERLKRIQTEIKRLGLKEVMQSIQEAEARAALDELNKKEK